VRKEEEEEEKVIMLCEVFLDFPRDFFFSLVACVQWTFIKRQDRYFFFDPSLFSLCVCKY
jgi:hypothetical protein